MPLQDMVQKFSCMQAWQILNPHRHVQLKGVTFPQQEQGSSFLRVCRRFRARFS